MVDRPFSDSPEVALSSYNHNSNAYGTKSGNGSIVKPQPTDRKEDPFKETLPTGQKRNETKKTTRRKGRRKNDSIVGLLCQLIVKHQIGIVLVISVWETYPKLTAQQD